MASDIVGTLKQACDRLLPERQLYYRSGGEFRFLSISRRQQIMGCLLLAGVMGWSGYAVTGLIVKDRTIAAKDARIAKIAGDYDLLAAHVRQVQNRLVTIAEELEGKHKVLDSLWQQNSSLHGQVGTLSHKLKQTRTELQTTQRDKASLETRRTALRNSLDATAALAETLRAGRNMAIHKGEALKHEVVTLQNRLALLEAAQEQLVSRIEERADINISELEAVIEGTGLDVDALLDRVETEGGVGGPFVGLASSSSEGGEASELSWLGGLGPLPPAADESGAVPESLERLESRLARWSALKMVLEQIPFAAPVDVFWISSRFGKRRDPMTKRWAVHYGVDLAGPAKQPVFATAPGVVTFAGWNGPYGRMVEIDHGFGIKTRYGHLYRIKVKKGQQIGRRDKIGLVGSTGRSTGSHVHYEVHFDGKPIDPGKLIEAGKHVLKARETE